MIADSARFRAYAKAISRCVRPGDVVVEIGCGPAVFACWPAAREHARYTRWTLTIWSPRRARSPSKTAYAERIQFLQSDSRKTELPERANIIVSDIRGVLPLFDGAVASIIDAKQRFLAPEGVMIPRREVLKAAIVDANQVYSELIKPWREAVKEAEFSTPLKMILNTPHSARVKPEQLMSQSKDFCFLDYAGDPAVNAGAELSFSQVGTEPRTESLYGLKLNSVMVSGFRPARNQRSQSTANYFCRG